MTVKSSSRPRSIPPLSNHFAVSGRFAKFPAGPTTGPRPGPTFAMAAAALENAVKKSNPRNPRANARIQNEKNHMKKNPRTDMMTSSEMG